MRGRKPVPTVLRLARGNPGRRPLNRAEPSYPPLAARAPAELIDAEARAEWRRVVVPASHARHLTRADRALAIAHCQLFSIWLDQLREAATSSHVMDNQNGNPIANPARAMANQTLALLVKIDAELGLTPTSRSRVKISDGTGANNLFAQIGRLV